MEVNVGDYIEQHGSSDGAIQAAINELNSDGGVVRVPQGTYAFHPHRSVELPSQVTLEGEGPKTLLRREGDTGRPMIGATGTEGIRISRCAFEHFAAGEQAGNFIRILDLDLATDAEVAHCQFAHTGARPSYGQTMMAILARGNQRLRVHHSVSDRMQFKLGGPRKRNQEHIEASDNLIYSPYNHGISCVAAEEAASTRHVRIERNTIVGIPSQGGIFVGPDGPSFSTGEFSYLSVVDNVISGTWDGDPDGKSSTVGIIVSPGAGSHDWHIGGNTIVNEGAIGAGTIGIRLSNNHDQPVHRLRVVGNSIGGVSDTSGMDQWGIDITLPVVDLLLQGNMIHGARGVRLATGPVASHYLQIAGNILHSNSTALELDSGSADFENVLVTNNQIEASGPFKAAVYQSPADTGFYDAAYLNNRLSGHQLWNGHFEPCQTRDGNLGPPLPDGCQPEQNGD